MNSPELFERIRFRGRPQAHPDAVVISGQARFTALTPRLIRLEWSETGQFEDRGAYAFPTRYTETPPAFTLEIAQGILTLDTGALALRYQEGSGKFTPDTLAITFALNGETATWRPGMPNPRNLRGTRRTLDQCRGEASLDEGLISRDGWALFDDSKNVLFTIEDGWVAPQREHDVQDWYFFAYGHDYRAALRDYLRFGGPAPLIPRYILGGWWSRFWAYSDQDLKDLVAEFEAHDVPLDVLVVDIDWHLPNAWTGYTWNRELFPDPPGFLRWVHDKGLRSTFNLHPAQGVQPFEEMYPEFAEAMGMDPAGGEPAPFTIGDKRFVEAYFKILHHPMEDDGVDFWWVDWQQGEVSDVTGLDPLPWLNHLHFNDIKRLGVRPMLYSRWGGLGNHRYYIGFSGDTYETWDSLAFQPYFTATASNVGYGWWSHDIGGHMGGAITDEMYARWVQYGALSPILRLHATKDPRCERRPWAFNDEAYRAAKAAFHWRYRLVPYLYTMARRQADTGESLCMPLYYDYPETEAAYVARFQYFFGDQLLAAPLVHPADPETGVAFEDVWIPEGAWIDLQTQETFTGPRWVRLLGDLQRMPVLVKAGGILPLSGGFEAPEGLALTSGVTGAQKKDHLVIEVYPGAAGRFRLYEDDGLTEAYREGEFEWTGITTVQPDAAAWTVAIAAVEGRCTALPEARAYDVRLVGCTQPDQVWVAGQPVADWSYDPGALTATISLPKRSKSQPVTITAVAAGGIVALGEQVNRRVIAADVQRLLGERCPADPLDAAAVLALPEATPGRSHAIARLGGPLARVAAFVTLEDVSQQLGRVIVGAPAGGEAYDLAVTFVHRRVGSVTEQILRFDGTTEAHIIDTPFAFDGAAAAQSWSVVVSLTWRGVTWREYYEAAPLFPTVTHWRAVASPPEAPEAALAHVLRPDGTLNPALDWRVHIQDPAAIPNLTEPHGVMFWRDYEEPLKAGEPLVGYAAAVFTSPEEREVVFEFHTPGRAELFLNGEAAPLAPRSDESHLRPVFRSPFRSQPLTLRAGVNTLLARLLPSEEEEAYWWYFGGRFVTPDGDLVTDLVFS